MIRKFIILLSVCCMVLCAIVGYLSKQVDQESDLREGEATAYKCADFLADPPTKTGRILVTEFGLGKHIAHIDGNDDEWQESCVPFFPTNINLKKYGYSAILVCFNEVKSKEEIKTLTKDGSLDTDFWPGRQELNPIFHSQLAQDYTNMDFSKTIVLHYCLLYTSPSPRDATLSRMPSSA